MSNQCLVYIENTWKMKVETANTAFQTSDFLKAQLLYQEALCQAEVLNKHPMRCLQLNIPFVQIFIISCHNIAYNHLESKQIEKADQMFKRAVFFVAHMMDRLGVELTHSLHLSNEFNKTLLAYNDFCNDYQQAYNQEIKQLCTELSNK